MKHMKHIKKFNENIVDDISDENDNYPFIDTTNDITPKNFIENKVIGDEVTFDDGTKGTIIDYMNNGTIMIKLN